MKFILGTKEYMTQIFDEDGIVHPVTVVKAGPVTVVGARTMEVDGYDATVLGFGEKKEKRASKAEMGRFGDAGIFAHVHELRELSDDLKIGDVINPDTFEAGDSVHVSGISKGKGFQGVVKRHGFAGGRRTHGQKHSEREPGSIGAGGIQRVLKGLKMAGRMGGDRVTVKNLSVARVDKENNLLFVRGAIPGRRGTLIEVRGVEK